MLDPESWLELAQAVPEGKERKATHDCGPQSMVVGHKPGGWWAWCHRCHDKGWVPKPAPSLQERAARRAAQEAADEAIRREARPPYPGEFNVAQWPAKARAWLYKAGLFDENVAELGAYWHEPSQRVVLPVLAEGRVVHWQARNVGLCEGPKYIGPRAPAGTIVPRWGDDSMVVLTEDLLSAFRVGMGGEGWCLMGTVLHPPLARLLLLTGKPVAVWLDPDSAGDKGAARTQRDLDLYGIRNTKIESGRDPKLLSRAEVARYIQGAKDGFV